MPPISGTQTIAATSDDPVDSAGQGAARGPHIDGLAVTASGAAGGLLAGGAIGLVRGFAGRSSAAEGAPGVLAHGGKAALIGGAIGLVGGLAAWGVDKLSGGGVAKAVPPLSMLTRNQLWALVQHPLHPQLGPLSLQVAADAVQARKDAYGGSRGPDAGDDAFRHAYASALLATRLQHWGSRQSSAADMTMDVGRAHEDDGSHDPANLPRQMDLHNDQAGIDIAGNGHDSSGDWLSPKQLQQQVFAAMVAGKLDVVEYGGDVYGHMRPSAYRDLPVDMRDH